MTNTIRPLRIRNASVFSALLLAGFANAQVPSAVPPSPAQWTLADVLRRIDDYYPKLAAVRIERNVADGKAQEKRGAFDPVIASETEWLRYNSSTTPGSAKYTRTLDTTIEILSRTGLKLAFGGRLNLGAVKSPRSATGSLGELFVTAKLPLLRDGNVNPKAVAERQAILEQPLADQAIRAIRFDTLLAGSLAYWEWVGAGEKLKIAQDLFKIADDRAQFIARRVAAEDLPRIDLVEANTEVFRRKGALEKAERDLQKAEIKLSQYLWSDDGAPLGNPSRMALPPLAVAEQVAPNTINPLEDSVTQALKLRPELQTITIAREVFKLDLALARNDRSAALDLTLGPTNDFGDESIGAGYKAGLLYSLPLVQNTADGRIASANAKLRKLDLEETQQKWLIRNEVADAVSNVEQTRLRVEAAILEVNASRELERLERNRFDLGEGTLFLLNQRERARAEAEARWVDVRIELRQAIALYQAVTAQLNP